MTNRFESISGILTPTTHAADNPDRPDKARETAAGAATEPTPAPVTLRPASSTAGSRRRPAEPAPQPRPKSATADGEVRRIAFRVDPDLYAALTSRAGRDGGSHGQVVLDSIENAHTAGVLAALITQKGEPGDQGGLFPRLKARGPSRPTIPVEIRLHARAVAVIDDLVRQSNADSRTQLITAALQRHLA